MDDVISFLRMQADSILDTARRCLDPEITSELEYIGSDLRKKADELEKGRA